jgi:DNA-binding Xre family transcriptional regulator
MRIVNRLDELVAVKERIEGRRISNRVIVEETGLGLSTVRTWRNNEVTRYDAAVIEAICKWVPCEVGDLFTAIDAENKTKALQGIPEGQKLLDAILAANR